MKCSEPRRAATDLSLGSGQLAPRRRAESLTLHFDRLTLPADSVVTASSLAGLTLNSVSVVQNSEADFAAPGHTPPAGPLPGGVVVSLKIYVISIALMD